MRKDLVEGLAWGGGIVALALVMALARRMGYLDNDTVTRVVVGSNGLLIAWYGNRMPKVWVPDARAREARRIAAWSQVLSGLVYIGLFVFAPLSVALVAGSAVVLAGVAVTVGSCLAMRRKGKASA